MRGERPSDQSKQEGSTEGGSADDPFGENSDKTAVDTPPLQLDANAKGPGRMTSPLGSQANEAVIPPFPPAPRQAQRTVLGMPALSNLPPSGSAGTPAIPSFPPTPAPSVGAPPFAAPPVSAPPAAKTMFADAMPQPGQAPPPAPNFAPQGAGPGASFAPPSFVPAGQSPPAPNFASPAPMSASPAAKTMFADAMPLPEQTPIAPPSAPGGAPPIAASAKTLFAEVAPLPAQPQIASSITAGQALDLNVSTHRDAGAPPHIPRDIQARAKIVIIGGADRGREFLLMNSETKVGRGTDNDVVLTDIAVSRHHCVLSSSGGVHGVRDLGSGNGTLVNGEKAQAVALHDGDQVEIGNTLFRIEIPLGSASRPDMGQLPAHPTAAGRAIPAGLEIAGNRPGVIALGPPPGPGDPGAPTVPISPLVGLGPIPDEPPMGMANPTGTMGTMGSLGSLAPMLAQSRSRRRVWFGVVIALLIGGGVAAGVVLSGGEEKSGTKPEGTAGTAGAKPEGTAGAAGTKPEGTEGAKPEGAAGAAGTKPEGAAGAAGTKPEGTAGAAGTKPEGTAGTPPEVTKPVVTKPEVTKPVVTKPEVTKPVVTKPVTTKPVVTKPVTTKPVVTKPEVTKPVVTKPVTTKPVVTKPVESSLSARAQQLLSESHNAYKNRNFVAAAAKLNEVAREQSGAAAIKTEQQSADISRMGRTLSQAAAATGVEAIRLYEQASDLDAKVGKRAHAAFLDKKISPLAAAAATEALAGENFEAAKRYADSAERHGGSGAALTAVRTRLEKEAAALLVRAKSKRPDAARVVYGRVLSMVPSSSPSYKAADAALKGPTPK